MGEWKGSNKWLIRFILDNQLHVDDNVDSYTSYVDMGRLVIDALYSVSDCECDWSNTVYNSKSNTDFEFW